MRHYLKYHKLEKKHRNYLLIHLAHDQPERSLTYIGQIFGITKQRVAFILAKYSVKYLSDHD